MADVFVYKKEDGSLDGHSEKDKRAYLKLRRTLNELEIGEGIKLSWKLPRSRPHHGFFFAKLRELFDRQENFADPDRLLDWLKVGAGYADLFPGPGGVPCAVPKSISWDECDEQTFIEVARGIDDFMWTEYAQATLWPHLDEAQRHDNVEGWHKKAEENRQLAILRMHEAGKL